MLTDRVRAMYAVVGPKIPEMLEERWSHIELKPRLVYYGNPHQKFAVIVPFQSGEPQRSTHVNQVQQEQGPKLKMRYYVKAFQAI